VLNGAHERRKAREGPWDAQGCGIRGPRPRRFWQQPPLACSSQHGTFSQVRNCQGQQIKRVIDLAVLLFPLLLSSLFLLLLLLLLLSLFLLLLFATNPQQIQTT
jgi:hypothetical protein